MTSRLIRATFGLAVWMALALAPPGAAAEEGECRHIDGPFTSTVVPPPTCTSPVGLCTHGILEGDLDATYDFTAQTLEPANDPDNPSRLVYTGTSVITLDHGRGQMFSNDHGYIDVNYAGGSPFATTVVIARGTYQFEHTGGTLVASGVLDFSTGQAAGSYTGALCTLHHDDHDRD